MYDAGSVGLLCALAWVGGAAWAFWHARHYMGGSISTAEVDRRTAPPESPTKVDVE